MLRFYLFTICLFFIFSSRAQNFSWAKVEGLWAYDYGYGIATDDSGYIYLSGKYEQHANFSGTILPMQGNHDIYLAKYSPSGSLIWIRSAGGLSGDYATGISCDGSNYVYIAGEIQGSNDTVWFQGTSTYIVSKGDNDVFLAKYDLNGNLMWAKQGGWWRNERSSAVTHDNNGNVIVGGFFTDTTRFGGVTIPGYGGRDIFFAKFDANGNYLWFKKAGGKGRDETKGIVCDSAGNIYVCGMFEDTAVFQNQTVVSPNGYFDIFVAKYDPTGNLVWLKTFGANYDEVAWDLALDDSGKVFITGEFHAYVQFDSLALVTSGKAEVFVVCLSPTGNVLWAKSAGGDLSDRARGITSDGENVYITGQYGLTAEFDSFQVTAVDSSDIFFAALDNAGNFKWVATVGGIADSYEDLGYESGITLCADKFGNIYGTGALLENGVFGDITVGGWNRTDIFMTKITQGCTTPPLQPTSISGPLDVCQSSTNTYTILPINGATSYTWTTPSGWSGTSASTSISLHADSIGGEITVVASNACGTSELKSISVNIIQAPTTANAGPDETVCVNYTTLAGNTPTTGTGSWSVVSGTATIDNPASANSTVSAIGIGDVTLRWTITSNGCNPSFDDIVISRISPDIANAGPDQSICAASTVLAGNTPTTGIGQWSIISGTATITDPTSATSTVTGIETGLTTLRWTISNNSCTTYDQVDISRSAFPTVSDAGPDQNICITTTTLDANTAVTGSGLWSLVSGTATIASPTDPKSALTEIYSGTNTLRWTISANGCDPSFSDVNIIRHEYPDVQISSTMDSICQGAEVQLFANGAFTYLWLNQNVFGDSLLVKPDSTTNYSLVGTDLNGCSDTAQFTLVVNICLFMDEQEKASAINIFPNPGKKNFQVSGINFPDELIVYSTAGSLVAIQKIEKKDFVLDLPDGIYFIEFNRSSNTSKKKLIIKK